MMQGLMENEQHLQQVRKQQQPRDQEEGTVLDGEYAALGESEDAGFAAEDVMDGREGDPSVGVDDAEMQVDEGDPGSGLHQQQQQGSGMQLEQHTSVAEEQQQQQQVEKDDQEEGVQGVFVNQDAGEVDDGEAPVAAPAPSVRVVQQHVQDEL